LFFATGGGYIGNYLHQSFHVKGHWLERYGWFHELRAVHYIHHLHSTRHNYAVLNVGLDWLAGSLVLDEALKDSDDEDVAEQKIDIAGLGALATITLGMQHVSKTTNHDSWAWNRGLVAVLMRLLIVGLMIRGWLEA
jgi:hypothetical protein